MVASRRGARVESSLAGRSDAKASRRAAVSRLSCGSHANLSARSAGVGRALSTDVELFEDRLGPLNHLIGPVTKRSYSIGRLGSPKLISIPGSDRRATVHRANRRPTGPRPWRRRRSFSEAYSRHPPRGHRPSPCSLLQWRRNPMSLALTERGGSDRRGRAAS